MAHYELKGATWVKGHGDKQTEFTMSGEYENDEVAAQTLSNQVREKAKRSDVAFSYSIKQGDRFLELVNSEGMWDERDFGVVTIR